VAICWSSLVGAVVWFWYGPDALLYVAFGFGSAGAVVFYLWVRDARGVHPGVESGGSQRPLAQSAETHETA
jgi:hypothetical protein